jgi:hypothetical protein
MRSDQKALKTLVCCGTATGTSLGQAALWRWWFTYGPRRHALGATHFAVSNDGCTNLPVERFVDIKEYSERTSVESGERLTFVYHRNHLGRCGMLGYAGFWRNLSALAMISIHNRFDRMIYIEWDFFILSDSMLHEAKNTNTGLVCYWCPRYGFPESGMFVCSSGHMESLLEIAMANTEACLTKDATVIERCVPWTEIRKNRVGDRYPEYLDSIPQNADYCAQLPIASGLFSRKAVRIVQDVCPMCGSGMEFDSSGILSCKVCGLDRKE